MSDKKIYKLNNDLLFRLCEFDDCTNTNEHWGDHIKKCSVLESMINNCFHEGDIHFHCAEHREIELSLQDKQNGPRSMKLTCAICSLREDYQPPSSLQRLNLQYISTFKQQSKALLASNTFKGAKLIRLDDYYTPELSAKVKTEETSNYWVSYDVKENKQGQPILVLYLGNKKDGSKCQFFIEPETNKLSHDHKDTNPLSVLARIEVQFKDGVIELRKDS
jgi:hypothetical protein